MKREEVLNNLAKYLVKRDQHLDLNKVQADQLAHYVMLYIDKHMSPKYNEEEK